MPITERTRRLKQRARMKHTRGGEFINPALKMGSERAILYTESFKQTEAYPLGGKES